MSMVNLVTCLFSLVYFHSFEALNDAFEVQFFFFQGFSFYTLSKTLIACRAMQLRFFQVETLLNNAFNGLLLAKIQSCILSLAIGFMIRRDAKVNKPQRNPKTHSLV